MFRPVKVMDIDFQHPVEDIENLNGYGSLLAFIRLHGTPIGYIKIPVSDGRCSRDLLVQSALKEHGWSIISCLLRKGLENPVPSDGYSIDDLLQAHETPPRENVPLVTVAVCTRDRTADLANCLDAIEKLDYPTLDVLVIDNAPDSNATECLVRDHFPRVRYVKENRPGLDWARNRAIQEAQGEIIAFTDDDAFPDSNWVTELVKIFSENPSVMAVTGLVVPYQLETEAQVQFENFGGFGRGFKRQWYRLEGGNNHSSTMHIGAGRFGTGANMAYRRSLFNLIGNFDPALDVGTVTNGGGDLELFFRVLQEGYMLVYEPSAIVRHSHRRTHSELQRQITTWGTGFYSYLVCCAVAYPNVRWAVIRFGVWHLWWRYFRSFLSSLLGRSKWNRRLLINEFLGVWPGLVRYFIARRNARKIRQTFGPQASTSSTSDGWPPASSNSALLRVDKTAVRTVDLSQPLAPIKDVNEYASVRIFVTWREKLFGHVDIANHWQGIAVDRLQESIADTIGVRLLEIEGTRDLDSIAKDTLEALSKKFTMADTTSTCGKAGTVTTDGTVSIVLATYDRPDHLHNCLQSLHTHQSRWDFEIIVVDNNPESYLTPPIVAMFPGIRLVPEPQKGLSRARNAGIMVSKGDIIVTTDDDVIIPPGWLDNLLEPFSRAHVLAVTGNVIPYELENRSQLLFEMYGGLGRGHIPLVVDRNWFNSFKRTPVPTWRLGATANSAFRSSIFSNPRIGLLDEVVSTGTPAGCGEDTYLYYKILKEGGAIAYHPTAYVWHIHRRDLPGLKGQLYNYSKGHVAYHLTTLIRDYDRRGIFRLFFELPLHHCKKILKGLLGRSSYPLLFTFIEIAGNLAGPFGLLKSLWNFKRQGRTRLYLDFPTPEDCANLCIGNEVGGLKIKNTRHDQKRNPPYFLNGKSGVFKPDEFFIGSDVGRSDKKTR